ncbi:MAG TPA: PAS domain-containing protein [Rhizomicrobium sp.]
MGDFSCFDRKIESPALRAIAAHWNEVRKDRRMPSWSDLRPTALAPYFGLIWVFRYDRTTKEFTARLAGNRMMVACGKSFRGTPLRELHPPEIFPQAQAGLMRVVSEPACGRTSGPLFKADGKITCGERIVLPLGVDDKADGAFGASDYNRSFVTAASQIETIYNAVEWFSL